MNKYFLFALVCIFSVCVQSKWTHEYDSDTSKQIAASVKNTLLANIDRFANSTFAEILRNDLNEADDSKRKLKEIDEASVSQIFSLFNLSSEDCKFDSDNFLRKSGLKCLNNIWKNYVPK